MSWPLLLTRSLPGRACSMPLHREFSAIQLKTCKMIKRLRRPNDFVLATGILHSVREFVDIAYSAVGLNWREHVVGRNGILDARHPARPLCGRAARLQAATGWRPRVSFEEMVRIVVAAEERQSWTAFDV